MWGVSWRCREAVLAVQGQFYAVRGRAGGFSWPSSGSGFGVVPGFPEGTLVRFETLFEASWAILKLSRAWGLVRPSWSALGASWRLWWSALAVLEAILGTLDVLESAREV